MPDNKQSQNWNLTEDEWRQRLTPEQFQVTRRHGTERAFTGPWLDEKRAGVFQCIACDNPLFETATKYESGSGWPSFFKPVSDHAIELKSVVRAATAMSGMCFPMARNQPVCVIAPMVSRLISSLKNKPSIRALCAS